MIVKYWGVRGSIPSPLTGDQVREKQVRLIKTLIKDGGTQKLFGSAGDAAAIEKYLATQSPAMSGTYGGDTTCVEIQAKDSPLIIIDAGTGIRHFGQVLFGRIFAKQPLNPLNSDPGNRDVHLFLSHYHWDHLQGFPFFGPGFLTGKLRLKIHFYGRKNTQQRLSEVLAGQQQCPNFPVVWDDMPCEKTCVELGRLEAKAIHLGATTICYQELSHPDAVFAYSIEVNKKKFVFATDTEHKDSTDPRLLKISQKADILYYDSQYSPEDYIGTVGSVTGSTPKFDWGHSTYEWAVKSALGANVPVVVLGHHDPLRNDWQLEELLHSAQAFRDEQLKRPEHKGKKLDVILGRQGMEHVL